MGNRRLLTVGLVASLLCAGWLGHVALRLSARDCSMSDADRVALVQRLDPVQLELLLERVLGSDGNDRRLAVDAPTDRRDFALAEWLYHNVVDQRSLVAALDEPATG